MPSRPVAEITVLVDGQEVEYLKPLDVQRSAGGGRLDYARFQYDLRHLQDQSLSAGGNQEIEVRISSEVGGDQVIHWGKTQKARLVLDRNGREIYELESRIEPFHFGKPLFGQVVYHGIVDEHQTVAAPIVFNPMIDHRIYGNMRDDHPAEPGDFSVFVDPESARTPGAKFISGIEDEPQLWTLSKAVHYLCQVTNGDETYIKNPSIGDIEIIVTDEGSTEVPEDEDEEGPPVVEDLVRDLRLRDGLYLPQALDQVLNPFGYSWFVALGEGERQIVLYKRGVGLADLSIELQTAGEPLDTTKTNLIACDIDIDTAALYNQVRGYGGYIEIESSWELYRGWSESEDELGNSPTELMKSHEDWLDNQYVWRRWVLNEAGDYFASRTEVAPIPGNFDFTEYLPEEVQFNQPPRRLRFYPTLTKATDNQRPIGTCQGCEVEYWDTSVQTSGEWRLYPGDVHLLHDQCGIYFSGEQHPDLVSRAGDSAKVRITATIRFDIRITAVSERQDTSPQADIKELQLDLRDRFHYRKVHENSKYFEDVENGDKEAFEDDDREALQTYVDNIREAWDGAAITGPFVLEGLDNPSYEIGSSLVRIKGREISLHGKVDESFPPQIIGISYDIQGQMMTLQTEQYRADKKFLQDKQGIQGDLA